jgi:two-component system, chemotaxis family, CheB/CheR fusion protein
VSEGPDSEFESLLDYLRDQRGFDFTGYKRTSLVRRVQRRMQAVGIASYDEYQDYMQVRPEEFTELFNTILINVTGFFRDPDAWDHLRDDVLPGILERRANGPLRLWSAGCASGEEAYTLAMLLAEAMGVAQFRERVKIYATDVDEEALAFARQATFNDREIEGVPPELVERYFDSSDDKHLFRKELRRSVIFGRNDLVQDAPISHVDLLLCRNTLMYFNAEAQAQILNRLHFALRPDGVLFLGKAEMLLSHGHLFAPIELSSRLFRKVATQPSRERRFMLGNGGGPGVAAAEDGRSRLRELALLSSPAPQVVVDDSGRLALMNHRAETVFGVAQSDLGRPFRDLDLSYRPLELRQYLDEVVRERRTVWIHDVEPPHDNGANIQAFDVQLQPLVDEAGTMLGTTITFNDVTRSRQLQAELEYSNRRLETAYEELQSTNEELETTNEELQSTVEELETTNEELQSTNEELETMNEELQSMNDELHFSNDQLRDRQAEVDDLNLFMESVLAGLRAGVAVVDRELKVLAWNTQAEDLWGVRTDEAIGQHLLNLDIGLPLEQLLPLLRRQVNAEDSHHETLHLAAVNRRGRSVDVSVTVSPLHGSASDNSGAILVMDLPEE